MEDSLLSKFVDKWKVNYVIFLFMDKGGGVGGVGGVGWTLYYEYKTN